MIFLSKDDFAVPLVPATFAPLIDKAVEHAQGRPWIVTYWATQAFHEILDTILNEGPPPSEKEIAGVGAHFRLMITALLERLGADPLVCSDPFQATVYSNSARDTMHPGVNVPGSSSYGYAGETPNVTAKRLTVRAKIPALLNCKFRHLVLRNMSAGPLSQRPPGGGSPKPPCPWPQRDDMAKMRRLAEGSRVC